MPITQKPTHGGPRKGAGRPKAAIPKVNLTVSIPPTCKARIQQAAKAAGVSASEIVARRFE